MTWTRFMDMHSGGGTKEHDFEYIYIEAPEAEAKCIFYHRFGHNPEQVSCTCCGEDYTISEHDSLAQATASERNCRYAWFRADGTECEQEEAWQPGKGFIKGGSGRYVEESERYGDWKSSDDYLRSKYVLVIYAQEIQPHDRVGDIPEQGYVWKD